MSPNSCLACDSFCSRLLDCSVSRVTSFSSSSLRSSRASPSLAVISSSFSFCWSCSSNDSVVLLMLLTLRQTNQEKDHYNYVIFIIMFIHITLERLI